MKLLITGAHGLLGRVLLQTDWGGDVERVGCGRRPDPVGDIPVRVVELTDAEAVHAAIAAERPDWVIHTAALTGVDQCETDPQLARRTNVEAVAHVVAASAAVDAGVVQLSTDYVFDGTAGPYAESDSPNPLSNYGRLKLESEALVLGAGTPGLVLRTLWLYGHRQGARPNFVTWALAALAGGETMRVVDDQWGNPTYVDDLARALVELCRRGVTGCYHMGGGTYMTRLELVEGLADHYGLPTPMLESTTTAELAQAAPRPLRSGLRTDALQTLLGWEPASFVAGLGRLDGEAGFRADFGALLERATGGPT